jgi:hypothetical protein
MVPLPLSLLNIFLLHDPAPAFGIPALVLYALNYAR